MQKWKAFIAAKGLTLKTWNKLTKPKLFEKKNLLQCYLKQTLKLLKKLKAKANTSLYAKVNSRYCCFNSFYESIKLYNMS